MTKLIYPLSALVLIGCFEHHEVGRMSPGDSGVADVGVDTGSDTGFDAGECDLSAVECTALPGCVGPSPPETTYCDDVRICLFSDPGDEMAMAINAIAERIQCNRADSCDFLCGIVDGRFDDEVRAELCEITRVAPSASIECAIYGP